MLTNAQAGPLSQKALLKGTSIDDIDTGAFEERKDASTMSNKEKSLADFNVSPSGLIDIHKYKPEVDANGTWWVSEVDCEFLATGCSVLACGGGGPGYMTYLAARAHIQNGKRLPVVDIDSLPEDGFVLGSISYGYCQHA
jgi:hypothetical protein